MKKMKYMKKAGRKRQGKFLDRTPAEGSNKINGF